MDGPRVLSKGYVCVWRRGAALDPKCLQAMRGGGAVGRRGPAITMVLALTYSLGRDRNGFKDNYTIIKCSSARSLYKDRDVLRVSCRCSFKPAAPTLAPVIGNSEEVVWVLIRS